MTQALAKASSIWTSSFSSARECPLWESGLLVTARHLDLSVASSIIPDTIHAFLPRSYSLSLPLSAMFLRIGSFCLLLFLCSYHLGMLSYISFHVCNFQFLDLLFIHMPFISNIQCDWENFLVDLGPYSES